MPDAAGAVGVADRRRAPGGSTVHASVGGRADNEVGFLWLAEDAPPPMAPDEFIRIEPVADGWWLFRTT